jgi:hypothetical protein
MLNFKKAGIFSRGSGQEDACEQEDQSGGVLAVQVPMNQRCGAAPAAARPPWPCGWPSIWPTSAGM